MHRRTISIACLALILCLAPTLVPAVFGSTAAEDSAFKLRCFASDLREGWNRARLGRILEARSLLQGLSLRLDRLEEPARSRCRDRLIRAFEALGDLTTARNLRAAAASARSQARTETRPLPARPPVVADPLARANELLGVARSGSMALEASRVYYGQALDLLKTIPHPSAGVTYRIGLCLEGLGQAARAHEAFRSALDLDPADPYVKFALARLSWDARDASTATALLSEGLALTIDESGTELLGRMLREMKAHGKKAEAMSTCASWLARCGHRGAMVPLAVLMAETQEEDGQLDAALGTYALCSVDGSPVANGGLARMLRLCADKGPIAALVKKVPQLVKTDAATPGYVLLAAADVSQTGGELEQAFHYLLAGFEGADKELFAQRLGELRKQAADKGMGDLERQIAALFPEPPREPVAPARMGTDATRPTDILAGYIFKVLLKARQTGEGLDNALGLALSASFGMANGFAFTLASGPDTSTVPLVRNPGLEQHSHDSPRYALVQPYLQGDLDSTMGVLRRLDPSAPVVSPVPPAPEPEADANEPMARLETPKRSMDPASDTPEREMGAATPDRKVPGATPERQQAEATPERKQPEPTPGRQQAEATPERKQPEPTPGRQQAEATPERKQPAPPPARVMPPLPPDPHTTVQTAVETLASSTSTEKQRLARILDVAQMMPDPLLIDLDGGTDRPELSGSDDIASSVRFDVAGWGAPQRVQWTRGSHAGWLCEDIDGDGLITSGLEMFGTAGGFHSGFEKLALRDANHDGVIDGIELDGLCVWVDRNGDGRTDPGELIDVKAAGLESIVLPGTATAFDSSVRVRGATHRCWEVWPQVFRIEDRTGSR